MYHGIRYVGRLMLTPPMASLFVDLPAGTNQVLVKTLCISVDPYLRIKLYPKPSASSEEEEEEGGEFAPFKLGQALSSMFVGEVVAAGDGVTAFKPGDRVSGVGPWARFAALDAATLQPVPSDVRDICVCIRCCCGV
jgi:NADPH-dependent curcumin reductase CurA